MYTFYPSIKINRSYQLDVSQKHCIYIEECGNPDGLPVLVVHGGPGIGVDAYQRRFFDPEKYRIILFDQRGAGRSTPYAELKENTTQELLSDIKKIRKHLAIDKMVLFGSSWGGCLALLYAEQFPEDVHALLLKSVFLGRPQDIKWVYEHGTNLFFPDFWHDLIEIFDEKEKRNIIQSTYKRLHGNDDILRMSAAKAWALWQARCLTLQPHAAIVEHFSNPHFALGLAKIETHYLLNQYFIEENQILNQSAALENIPGYLVHGRYDVICPIEAAWSLKQKWPKAELFAVREAGHASTEPGIVDAVIHASRLIAEVHGRSA